MKNIINVRDKIIIFCQAPADIPYVLSLYEKYKGDKFIWIYVINVENNYKFLKGLNLDVISIVFIPYTLKTFKNIFKIIKEKKRINFLNKQYFQFIINTDIYFFSRFEDWLTSSFLKYLEKRNSIYYIDHYDFSSDYFRNSRFNFKLLFLKFIYYIITGINFKVDISEKLPEFNYKNYNIIKQIPELNRGIFKKYKYQFTLNNNKKPIVLFLVSPCEEAIYDCTIYDTIQYEIIKSFKYFNWSIIIKGHPRLGVPDNILNFVDYQIPSYIPAEFIQIKKISMCLGIITSALAHFANKTNIETYSLLNIFQYKSQDSVRYYSEYLSKLSNNKISYFQNYKDFENIISSNSNVRN